ncbi:hypothetical protein TL16_g02799 [Triparma laevis f. inornata]|uniref:Uncharacterized protein n=2 Tax=Triparma laevis TaxID=1534972 RepID=A0A9W7A1S8_9STRA|nr:hypothetical protein TL16_g02799 [Triparma laevis f. inornata]GMH59815.1 hypothetical protein TrLO_g3451 [Triparma laevis f. longispina]
MTSDYCTSLLLAKTEMNMHYFENVEGDKGLDAALTSTSIFDLENGHDRAASTITATTTSDCGPLPPTTKTEYHDPEKEEVGLTHMSSLVALIIFFLVVIITSALNFFASPFSVQSPGRKDLEVSCLED